MESDFEATSRPVLSLAPFKRELTSLSFTERVAATDGGQPVRLPKPTKITALLSLVRRAVPAREEVASPLVQHKLEKIRDLPAETYGDTAWMHVPAAAAWAAGTVGDAEDEWKTVVHLARTVAQFGRHKTAFTLLEVMAEAGSAHAKLALIGFHIKMSDDKSQHQNWIRVGEEILSESSSPFACAVADFMIAEVRLLQGQSESGEWYERQERAAMRGHPGAINMLALHYDRGRSGRLRGQQAKDAAAALYASAIRRGSLQALTNSALLQWASADDDQGRRQGIWLLQHASRLGDDTATKAINRLDPQFVAFGLDPYIARRILAGEEIDLDHWSCEVSSGVTPN
jgi:hypothetical protein